jgi:hypothetical protein
VFQGVQREIWNSAGGAGGGRAQIHNQDNPLLFFPYQEEGRPDRAGIISKPEDWNSKTDRKFDFRISDPKHFTWLLKAGYEGKDEFREPLKIGIWRETGDYGEPTRSKRQEQPRSGL